MKEVSIDNLPEYLTMTEVSKLLNVHQNTLRNWDASGELKAVRMGVKRIRRYKKADILAFIKLLETDMEQK
ncbi:helix-turn-helix domain-containing protein [Candidatus Saccharibacteria bacterium]|nr:helix-turn-helix domain-containing protein [Candidatus Saccharibacteria bacterium]